MYAIDLHMHTLASHHAYSTLHDYISVATTKGLKLIAITDHGPDMEDAPHAWHFFNIKLIPRIINGVGVLRGIEANIKNRQGEIDCSDEMYQQLDIVIAGFHEPVFKPQDIDTNTQAMIATIENPKVNIISHPGNPKFPIHIQQVAQAAAKHGVALEINNSSFEFSRKGSEPYCRQIVAAVKEAGGYLAFGSDSHIAFTVGQFEHCLRITQEQAFPAERIINREVKSLLNFITRRNNKPLLTDFATLLENN